MKKILLVTILSSFISFALFAQEKNNQLYFDLTVDFAYHTLADYVSGGDHYAPITGIYEGLEARVTGNLNYVIPTPLGEHWLLKDANVKLQANFELSPVTIKPGIYAEFTPLPFLVFSAGAQIGTGWDAFGAIGAAKFNGTDDYVSYKPFEACFVKWFAQGTFQFDTEALWPGDWHHIQLMYSYQVYYEGLTNCSKGDVWIWQGTKNKANGICNYQNLILAYQMPLVFNRIGVMFELNGHYDASDYKGYENMKGDFFEIGISPMCQLKFTENDTLAILASFRTRRSFKESHDSYKNEPLLTYSGNEWFFHRLVLSYYHKF